MARYSAVTGLKNELPSSVTSFVRTSFRQFPKSSYSIAIWNAQNLAAIKIHSQAECDRCESCQQEEREQAV